MSLMIASRVSNPFHLDLLSADVERPYDKKRLLFIINRTAGTDYNVDIEKIIVAAGLKHHTDCSVTFTQQMGHAVLLAKAAVNDGIDCVVAVGGDGTVNEVAQGLVNSEVAMGIIPIGSGNGLARHLGISLTTQVAVDQLFDSRILPIDTFKINGRLSLNVSGIGFDGHITNLFGIKSKRGFLGYIKLAISEFLKFKEFAISIQIPGMHIDRQAFMVAVANSSQYGNNAMIAPMASVTDGLLHFNIVSKVPLYRLDFLIQFFSGRLHRSAYCEMIGFESAVLKTNIPIAFHIDGEPGGFSDTFSIDVKRKSLILIAPQSTGYTA